MLRSFTVADICCADVSLQATRIAQSIIMPRNRVAPMIICINWEIDSSERGKYSDRECSILFPYVTISTGRGMCCRVVGME